MKTYLIFLIFMLTYFGLLGQVTPSQLNKNSDHQLRKNLRAFENEKIMKKLVDSGKFIVVIEKAYHILTKISIQVDQDGLIESSPVITDNVCKKNQTKVLVNVDYYNELFTNAPQHQRLTPGKHLLILEANTVKSISNTLKSEVAQFHEMNVALYDTKLCFNIEQLKDTVCLTMDDLECCPFQWNIFKTFLFVNAEKLGLEANKTWDENLISSMMLALKNKVPQLEIDSFWKIKFEHNLQMTDMDYLAKSTVLTDEEQIYFFDKTIKIFGDHFLTDASYPSIWQTEKH